MSSNRLFFGASRNPDQIAFNASDASEQISINLLPHLPVNKPDTIVVVCVGTDRSTGDSLGPLVGTFLSEKENNTFSIYGTLEDPVHAVNLEEKINLVHLEHSNPFIIAVDACLGRTKSVGTVQIHPHPLKPGAGVHKDLPEVGNIHITGIVNVSGFMEFYVLQNTRLSLVWNMAKTIAESIELTSRSLLVERGFHKSTDWTFDQEKAT